MSTKFTRLGLFALALLLNPLASFSQLVITESFDGATFPPYGWNSQKIAPSTDANNIVIRRTTSISPAASPTTPRTGAGMASYESALMTVAGEKAYLATRPLDMRAIPVAGATGSFWMWRENNSTVADSISLYINDSSSVFYSGGAPVSCTALQMQQVAPFGLSTSFSRYATQAPAGTAGTWHQYNFTIPQAGNAIPNLSVIIVFTNRHTVAGPSNIYIDDFTVQSWPQQQVYASTTSYFQNTAVIPQGSTNNLIYGVSLTVIGGDTTVGNTFRVDSLNFNSIGSTNINVDAQNAKLWWTGGTNAWTGIANATQIGATQAIIGTNIVFYPANSFRLHPGVNYFWVTYDVKAVGVSTPGNCLDVEYIGCGLGGGGSTIGFKSPSTFLLPGCRPIDVAYCSGSTPSYSTGTSWLGGSYTNNDYVARVLMVGEVGYGQIDNNLNCCGPPISPWFGGPAPFSNHPPDYEKFAAVTNKTTAVLVGQTYSITLQVGTWFSSNFIAAWIDFDHDGTFALGERIAMSGALNANGTYTVSYTVPLGAYIGNTTLRVREVYFQSNIDPCASYTFGETEDYQITIIPPCTVYPGYNKVWLGTFDDDWNNSLNWCPAGVPVITSNTIIPGSSPNRPVIKNGVAAVTNKIKIQGNDSLTINAYGTGSFTIADSMNLVGSACMRVISQFSDTALVSTGTLNGAAPPNHITYGAAARQRCQLVYTQAELLARGMVAGDIVDSIYLLVKTVSGSGAGLTYNNFTVSYYYTNVNFNFPSPAYLAPIVTPGGTIYTNPSLTISSAQQLKFLLSTPFTWNGSANALVIDICYDKVTSGSPSHIMGYTQTLGFRRYMQIYATTASGTWLPCNFKPSQRAATNAIATTGGTVFTIGAWATGSNAASVFPGMLVSTASPNIFPAGTTVVSLVGTTLTTSAGNTLTIGAGQQFLFTIPGLSTSDVSCVSDRRPNLTFHFRRPYQVYPISVGGHWNNSATWIAGGSTVTFNGTLTPQKIEGTSFSTFKNLRLNKGASTQTVNVWRDVTVTDTLNLNMGRLVLNGNPGVSPRLVNLLSNTGLQGALTYTASGMLVSESNPPNYGSFRWKIGKPATYPQTYTIPLANASGVAIPFTYILNADTGDVKIATYSTIPANTPIPTGVSDIYQNTWIAPPATDNSPNMVDRFWQVDEAGTTTNRDFTFRWVTGENAASGTGPYRAQVYDPSTNWGWPFIIGQSNPTGTSVTIPAVSFTNTWAVVKQDQPLPVELLSFRAKAHDDKKVICDWSTASEKNNDFFTVERSVNGVDFEDVGKVKGAGTVNEPREYTFVDNKPYRGISYYRLRQTDFDNRSERFNIVTVDLSLPKSTVQVYPVPASNEVVFRVSDSQTLDAAVLYVFDVTGRKLVTQTVSELKGNSSNMFVLPLTRMESGVYHFELRSDETLLGKGKFVVKK